MRTRNLKIVGLCLTLTLAVAGCRKKAPPPPPPPPIPVAAAPVPAPTAEISANPTSIERGQAATLAWKTANATEVAISPEVGAVGPTGTRQVRPSQSTTYTISAKGAAGSQSASTRVTVTIPPEPPSVTPTVTPRPTETVLDRFQREVQPIYFDYDSFSIRDDQRLALNRNGEFLRSNAAVKIIIEGHCDERGSAEYNLGLGDKRATTVRDALMQMGVSSDRIRVISYGREKPQCNDQTEECWQKNRRAQHVWWE